MAMAIKRSLIGLFLMFAPSCANGKMDVHNFSFHVSDDMKNKRFIFSLKNDSNHTLCLSPATWPNDNGMISMTSAKIYVSIGERIFPLQTFIEDCSDCTFKVKSKKYINGYLNYSAFAIPDSFFEKPKDLHVTPYAVRC